MLKTKLILFLLFANSVAWAQTQVVSRKIVYASNAYSPAPEPVAASAIPLQNSGIVNSMGLTDMAMLANIATQLIAPNSQAATWTSGIAKAAQTYQGSKLPVSFDYRTPITGNSGFTIPRDLVQQANQAFGVGSNVKSSSLHSPSLPFGPEGDGTMGDLALASAKSLENSGIGRGRGFSLSRIAGWAKLSADGSVRIPNGKSHCTSSTHAAFLTLIGQLSQRGLITLDSRKLAILNSSKLIDAWNSNGYGPLKIYELLGGQSFRNLSLVKKGDLVKIDRADGSGHMGVVSYVRGNTVCFISSQSSTNGTGLKCESGVNFTFARLTDTTNLDQRISDLGNQLNTNPAFADVRKRGGYGEVMISSLQLQSSNQLRTWASLSKTENRQTASLETTPGIQ